MATDWSVRNGLEFSSPTSKYRKLIDVVEKNFPNWALKCTGESTGSTHEFARCTGAYNRPSRTQPWNLTGTAGLVPWFLADITGYTLLNFADIAEYSTSLGAN